MQSDEPGPRLRIIVALNACRRDLTGLELAAQLAARKGCELEALFVEDVNLSNVAGLPFTKELTRVSGIEREFDAPRVERNQRASLSLIRQAIDRFNAQMQVHASLRVVRGHFVRTVLAITEDLEVLVLSRRGESHAAPARYRGGFPGAGSVMLPVWAVVDGSEQSLRALRVAAEFASEWAVGLIVAVPETPDDLPGKVRQRLPGTARPPGAFVHLITVEPFNAPTLLRHIRQRGCRLLVVKRADGDMLEEVADGVECPVVLA